MADQQLMLLNKKWALAYDHNQWVIRRRRNFDHRRKTWNWEAMSFVTTKKAIWRVLRDKGVLVDAGVIDQIDALPEKFFIWLIRHDPAAARRNPVWREHIRGHGGDLNGDDGAKSPATGPSVPETDKAPDILATSSLHAAGQVGG